MRGREGERRDRDDRQASFEKLFLIRSTLMLEVLRCIAAGPDKLTTVNFADAIDVMATPQNLAIVARYDTWLVGFGPGSFAAQVQLWEQLLTKCQAGLEGLNSHKSQAQCAPETDQTDQTDGPDQTGRQTV